MITEQDIKEAENYALHNGKASAKKYSDLYVFKADAYLAGCKHKSKEMEETAIGFAEYVAKRLYEPLDIPEMYKLYQEGKNK